MLLLDALDTVQARRTELLMLGVKREPQWYHRRSWRGGSLKAPSMTLRAASMQAGGRLHGLMC